MADRLQFTVVFDQVVTSASLPDTYMYRPTSQTVTGAPFALFADSYFSNVVLTAATYYSVVEYDELSV